MDSTWLRFTWEVPADGFQWLTGCSIAEGRRAKPTHYLTRVAKFTDSFLSHRYDIQAVPRGLFRMFADVAPTPEGVLTFADKYGALGGGEPFQLKASGINVVGEPLIGEPFALWRDQIVAMHRLIALWDLCHAQNLEGLGQHIQWRDEQGDRTVHYGCDPGNEHVHGKDAGVSQAEVLIASRTHHPEWLGQWADGDRMLPALFFLADEINKQLGFQGGLQMMWDPQRKQLALRLPVPTLRDLLWTQFAEAIISKRNFRKCKTCGTWFELLPGLARTNRLFCSEGCRSKLYRNRQEVARRLHAEGKSVKEIAQHLGSDVRTVKGWVSTKKE